MEGPANDVFAILLSHTQERLTRFAKGEGDW